MEEKKWESVAEWESRTGEIYPDDGPVWSRWNVDHKDFGKFMLITYERAVDEAGTDEYDKDRYIIIVATHHGKPEREKIK